MAALPPGCAGSASLGTFQLLIRPFSRGEPLPLKEVAKIGGGSRLIWDPVHLTPLAKGAAEVAAVLVPSADGDLVMLEPRKAAARTEWQLPERPQVIALLFGPEGLSEGKIKALVTHNPELLRELADYAEQSSEVETLVQSLANAEQSGSGAEAVLKGFSSQYGVAAPKLDAKATSDAQASALLAALMPATNAYDPLAGKTVQVQQSGGLAASLAGMFFGNPVALAAGGAALFTNLRTAMFPGTDFRSAFAQSADSESMALCTKNLAVKSKMRTAYLWAYRVPEVKKPSVSLVGTPDIPLNSRSLVGVKLGAGSTVKQLGLARDWRLIPAEGGKPVPVGVQLEAADSAELDLAKVNAPAGEYHLTASWDWESLAIDGAIDLRPYGDLAHVKLAPGEHDKLIEGSGTVAVKLTGADFEFLEKAALQAPAADAKSADVTFALPKGKRAGPQDSVTIEIDTARHGSYRLLLTQSNGIAAALPLTVLPPNPKISNLPVRVNQADEREVIRLEGAGLERLEGVESEAGSIRGAPEAHGWSGEIALNSGLKKGQRFPLLLKVRDLDQPLSVPDGIEVAGPRPRILSVQKSLAIAPGVEIGAGELPAGIPAGLVLTVDHLESSSQPKLQLSCEAGQQRQALTVSPSESASGASLTFSGPGALYLSVDPGTVGYAGCRLSAMVTMEPEGRSDPFELGRVIRIPRLDKFTLTAEKAGDSNYAGVLEGRDLDVIEKVGWDSEHGIPVASIPTPIPGDAASQSLRIVMSWPAPAPHASLYVWLRGESTGRKTAVTY